MSVKILIDSASDITKEEAEQMGVELIPLIVSFGDKEYYDGFDISHKEFYEKLVEDDVLPKTSQISPGRFDKKFKELTSNGDELIVITLSSKLSGTYSSAIIAAEEYKDKVFVVDSLNATVGERLLCEYAIRLIKKGLNVKEIVKELNKAKLKINIIAMVNTLEYLKKGGRISSTVAFAGELLSIKPVLSIIDGEVQMIGKAMGSKKGNNLLNKMIMKKGGIDFSMPYGVVWSGFDDTVLNKYIKDSLYLWEDYTDNIPAYLIGSTIGTHVGPGAIGFAFFELDSKNE